MANRPGGFPQRRYGPPLTTSVTANTNSGWSNIDSAFLGHGAREEMNTKKESKRLLPRQRDQSGLLDDANLKLSSVMAEVMGVSGRQHGTGASRIVSYSTAFSSSV